MPHKLAPPPRRLAQFVLRVAAPLVPARHRPDWLREWTAELDCTPGTTPRPEGPKHRSTPNVLAPKSAFTRSLGALPDAVALRWHEEKAPDMRSDFRYALRSLMRTPVLTLACVTTLAIGVGAAASLYALVDTVLLSPLPYPQSDQLVRLWETRPETDRKSVAPANFGDWREQARSFEQLAAFGTGAANVGGLAEPRRATVARVSGNFFDLLGATPRLGRVLRDDPADERAVVLAEGFWRQALAADPNVIGRSLTFDGEPYDVVGVGPSHLDFPRQVDAWIVAPLGAPLPRGFEGGLADMRDAWYVGVIGRLTGATTIATAQEEMNAIAARLALQYPDTNAEAGVSVVSLKSGVVGTSRALLLALLGAATAVLLAVVVNVANLTLARLTDRHREVAVRLALGGRGVRVARQLVLESLILSAAGGLVGAGLAFVAVRVLAAGLPPDTPRLAELTPDAGLLGVSLALATLTGCAFALWPAHVAASMSPGAALRGGRTVVAGSRGRHALLTVQVALAVALVSGTALMTRTASHLLAVDPGIRTHGVLGLRVGLPDADALSPAERSQFYDRVVARVGQLPDVERVGALGSYPLEPAPGAGLRIEGREMAQSEATNAFWNPVSGPAMETLGISLLRGRMLEANDVADGQQVAVVNDAFVRHFFAGDDAIGQRIRTGLDGPDGWWVTIVGVVTDTRNQGLDSAAHPMMFRPLGQTFRFGGDRMHFFVRSATPDTVAASVRRAIWELEPQAPIDRVATVQEVMFGNAARPRLVARILAAFAALSLTLAAVGVYGVMAQSVGRRRREIAVRMALGATQRGTRRLVIAQSAVYALAGLALGLVLTLAGGRLLEGLLFGVPAHDPVALSTGVAALALIALLAAWIPARRAAAIEPARSLQSD